MTFARSILTRRNLLAEPSAHDTVTRSKSISSADNRFQVERVDMIQLEIIAL